MELQNTQQAIQLRKKLLTVYSPKNCIKHASKLSTVSLAMNAEAPTLSFLKKNQGEKFMEALLMSWFVNLNLILNLKRPLTDEAIELCSSTILKEHYTLKISDLAFLFKRIYSGHYGEFYESLSVPKVLSFFNDYFEERCNEAEKESLSKHYDIKSDQTFNYSKNIRRIIQNTSSHSKS